MTLVTLIDVRLKINYNMIIDKKYFIGVGNKNLVNKLKNFDKRSLVRVI